MLCCAWGSNSSQREDLEQYSFQSEHCSLDSDYNGMQAVSSVTAPGASDGQVEEKEEEVEEKEEGKPPKTQPRIR